MGLYCCLPTDIVLLLGYSEPGRSVMISLVLSKIALSIICGNNHWIGRYVQRFYVNLNKICVEYLTTLPQIETST